MAKNICELVETAGIARRDTLFWNIVPWSVSNGQRRRETTDQDLQQALPYLRQMLELLPDLKAIVMFGKNAQKAEGAIGRVTSVRLFSMDMPSPRVFNVWPEKKAQTQEKFRQVAAMLQAPG